MVQQTQIASNSSYSQLDSYSQHTFVPTNAHLMLTQKYLATGIQRLWHMFIMKRCMGYSMNTF